MSGVLVPVLYVLSGICVYAALHHGFIAWHRPAERVHLLFASLCLLVALYVLVKTGAYQADSAQALVAWRRWEVSFGIVFLGVFPWFVAEYSGIRPRGLLAGLSAFMALSFAANMVLPYGLSFVEFPNLQHLMLPWGEQVVDLRVRQRGVWHNASWVGILMIFGYSGYACLRQYRRGARDRAVTLALGIGTFLLFLLFNYVVNVGLVEFTHTAEYGFLSLVAVMSLGLTHELHQAEKHLRASEERLSRQQAGLARLAKVQYKGEAGIKAVFAAATEIAVHTLGVERASIWCYTPDGRAIECLDLYERSRATHSRGLRVDSAHRPAYFAALDENRVIAAGDALHDPRTCELADGYLQPLGIGAMLDAPLRGSDGKVIGVVCHEHLGAARTWTADEQNFAASVADLVSLSMDLHERRAAEEALRVSERRFRSLVEQSPFSIQILSPDGRTLQVNRAWERLWGLKLEALAGYNILNDQQLAEKGALPYIVRGFNGKPAAIPPIVYNPQATPEVSGGPFRDRWVRAFVYPIKDERRAVREVILVHEDVTGRVHAEQALREIAAGVSAGSGEAFFRELVAHLAKLFDAEYAFIGLLDQSECQSVTTLALYARGAIAENISYALEDTPCANVIGQSTCAYPRGVQQLWPEDRLLTEMGIEGYIGTPLFDAQKRPLGLIVVLSSKPLERVEQVKEILEIFAARAGAELERSRAERALRESEERFSKAFRASPDAISLSRLSDGCFLDVNPGFERVSAYAREEVVGRNALELGLWADPAERERFVALLETEGAVRDLEMRSRRKGGVEILCEVSAQVLEIGGERCLLAVGRDITERRRLEERTREQELQLIQANKMAAMGTLVSSVAHEVNNPNNLVLMNAQMLAEVWADAARILDTWGAEHGAFELGGLPYAEMHETVPRLIHDTYEAARRIQKMVEDLRGFARPAAAGPRTRFAVNDTVRRAVELLRPLIHRKTARFSLTPAVGLPPLHGDSLKIEQVVVNLLVNALESLPEPARAVAVSTGLSADGQGVEICVRDEGCGIATEHLGRVFDAFFTTKLDRGGTGLGLAICHTLVKEHGGRIELDSAPDRGTRVCVFLPADAAASGAIAG